MNRSGFLKTLLAVPLIGALVKAKAEPKPEKENVCTAKGGRIIGVVAFTEGYNRGIIEQCEQIRKEAEQLAGRNYPIVIETRKGVIDFYEKYPIE